MRVFSRLLAVAALLGAASPAIAQSTAITYQGSLKSNGSPVSGPHDFRFTLFNAASGGVQIGSPQCADNVVLTDGLFTTTIDFGQQFATTEPRFLQIEVRTDTGLSCADPTGLITLGPRQPLTAAPIANHAKTAFTLAAADGSPANAVSVDNDGKVGIGTSAPTHTLHIASPAPTVALQDIDSTTQQVGYINYRDAGNVERAWIGYGTAGSSVFSIVNARPAGHIALIPLSGGNVGIGTSTPAAALDVKGDIRLGTSSEFFAVKSPQNDRILRGYVNANGTINTAKSGTGFSVTHTSTGVYVINFDVSFSAPPTVVLGAVSQCCKPRENGSQTNAATVHQNNSESPYTLTDSPFTFIIVGE